MSNSRFKKYFFNNGKVARNRLVIPPMASQTANQDGFVTNTTLEHYMRLSEAGAGIVFVEYSFVHQTGKGEPKQLGVNLDSQIEGLSKVADIIHKAGSLAGLQLVHVGSKTTQELTGFPLMGPSSIPVPVKGWQPETPLAMTEQQIEDWIVWFIAASKRVAHAGFDFVELHAAHGYGLNQWLSPLTNQRTDIFGGGMEGRSRLLMQVVERIKIETPELLVAVRVPAQDHFPGGLEIEEMIWTIRQLEQKGVDLIDVSSGIGGWRRPGHRNGQGYLVPDAASFKSHLVTPVIGVGGIETGEFIDQIINEKKVDFAAVGRAILADPKGWSQKYFHQAGYDAELAM
ncbi:MAG: NADH:flavin oxidoreductase [Pseudobdellovibrionaceae bacterium]